MAGAKAAESPGAGVVKKAMWTIMVATLLSRLLGWVKLTSLASLYGRGIETDAFYGSFAVPDLFYLLVSGGSFTAAFIPIFTEFIATGRDEEGWRFASTIWNMIMVSLLFFIAIGLLFTNKIVLILPGFRNDPVALHYAMMFVPILLPMILFTALAAMCNGVLHSFNHFTAPSLSWIVYNVMFIVAAYVFAHTLKLKGVCYGVLAGAMLMVAVQMPVMFTKGMKYSPFAFDIKNPDVKRYWRQFLPVTIGMSFTQFNLMIMPSYFGSQVGHGAITALNYANRAMFIPIGLFGSAISMAIYPSIARKALTGDFAELGKFIGRGVRATFIFSLPSSAILIAAGLPGIAIIFGHGKFGFADCRDTANALTYFAIGLIGHSANQILNRGFYARRDTMTPFVAGLLGLAITIPLANMLIKTPLGLCGIALAISVATIMNMIVLTVLAWKKLHLDMSNVLTMLAKTLTATALATAAGLYVGNLKWFKLDAVSFVSKTTFHIGHKHISMPLTALVSFVVISCVVGIVFTAVAKAFRISELDEMVAQVAGKLRRKRG